MERIKNKRIFILTGIIVVVVIAFGGLLIGQKLKKHPDGKNETETIRWTIANVEKEDTTEETERDSEEETTLEETTTEETYEETTAEETTVEETTEEPTTEAVEIEECEDVVWAVTDVNIRNSWSAASDVVGALLYGQSITRTGICSNGWIRVAYRDGEAYMNGKYLTEEEIIIEPETEAPTEAPTNIVVDVSTETPGDFHADIFADEYQKNQLKINHPEFSISQELSNRFAAILGPASTNVKFYALALDETFSFGYNPDTSYFAACTVKAGFALNLYKQVEQGNINLNDIMVYQEGMFHGGSGIIRNDPYGTEYTVQQVIDYSLLHSDNIAYDMVRDMNNRRFVPTYDEMIRSLGCTSSRLGSRNWVNTTARDMVKIMREIFWYGQSSAYGSYLLNTLQNTEWNYFQEEIPDKICQSKIGWTEDVCTMTGIVYGDKPYLLCVSSTTEEIFRQVVVLCDDIVDEYIQYENR